MVGKYSSEDAERIIKQEQDIKNLKPQGLRVVRYSYTGLRENPKDIEQESHAGVLFYNLQLCYKHQKNISEGAVGDILWGFRQSGIPPEVVMTGFSDLYMKNYLDFTDENGVVLLGAFNEQSWFKWNEKFFNLLEDTSKDSEILLVDSIKPEDKTMDDLKD